MPWKTIEQDGGEWLRKWHRTRLATLTQLATGTSKNLGNDELQLTVCCRYVEGLLANTQIRRFLGKHHPLQLRQLDAVVSDFKRLSGFQS